MSANSKLNLSYSEKKLLGPKLEIKSNYNEHLKKKAEELMLML